VFVIGLLFAEFLKSLLPQILETGGRVSISKLREFLLECVFYPAEVERLALTLSDLSTRQNFAPFLRRVAVLRGWARAASGETVEGISWIEDGIRNYRATGSMLDMPFLVALKAEALHLADRNPPKPWKQSMRQKHSSKELKRAGGASNCIGFVACF
jgi:hypothetical protein